jgi:hypothetical protein
VFRNRARAKSKSIVSLYSLSSPPRPYTSLFVLHPLALSALPPFYHNPLTFAPTRSGFALPPTSLARSLFFFSPSGSINSPAAQTLKKPKVVKSPSQLCSWEECTRPEPLRPGGFSETRKYGPCGPSLLLCTL